VDHPAITIPTAELVRLLDRIESIAARSWPEPVRRSAMRRALEDALAAAQEPPFTAAGDQNLPPGWAHCSRCRAIRAAAQLDAGGACWWCS
jgi:hypothetical protein